MASPKSISFVVFNNATGLPLTGFAGSLTFLTYKDETGADLTQPSIIEEGGGFYSFTPTFTTNHKINYVISTSTALPGTVWGTLRPEDFNGDQITAIVNTTTTIQQFQQGNWELVTSGPDTGKYIIYGPDGTTPLIKFALSKPDGSAWTPTSTANTKRTVTT